MKKYNINEVFDLLGKENLMEENDYYKSGKRSKDIIVEGFKVRVRSLRYMTFYQKGTTCSKCGRKGSYFKLEGDKNNETRKHFNLYSEDNILMTKDHIIPKSKGGKDKVSNMQTMCILCNMEKGNETDIL